MVCCKADSLSFCGHSIVHNIFYIWNKIQFSIENVLQLYEVCDETKAEHISTAVVTDIQEILKKEGYKLVKI